MILLVRHAAPAIDPARPATEWGLSDAGRVAARALGSSLRVDAVVSSPEPKALATAVEIDAPLTVDPRLREHDRAGVGWCEDFGAAVEAGFARPAAVVLGVESYDAALARFGAAVDDARREGERVAIVSHGTVIAIYAARALGRDPVDVWRGLAFPDVIAL